MFCVCLMLCCFVLFCSFALFFVFAFVSFSRFCFRFGLFVLRDAFVSLVLCLVCVLFCCVSFSFSFLLCHE